MYTSSFIRRHIYGLQKGQIFSTREMLNYGRRSAVDQCLYRLVKAGRIIRLAWGLFMKEEDTYKGMPSALEVAKEKARAFGRQVLIDAADAAKLLGLTASGNMETTFATQGQSTSFNYRDLKIHLKGICARKMALGDDPVGLAIKALWQLGRDGCHPLALQKATASFKRPERQQFRQSCHFMPTWMTNIFQT